MKNFIDRLTGILWGIFCVSVLVGFVYFCSSLKSEKVTDTSVAETNLQIRHNETKLYGSEEVTVIDYWYLINGRDTVDVCCLPKNPYVNAKGIVFIPKKGVYDCRNGNFKLVLPITLPATPYLDDIKIKASKDKVYITVGASSLDIKKLRLDQSKVKCYVYNLKTNKISEKK